MRSKTLIILFASSVIVIASIIAVGPLMSQVEQPTYTVERAEGSIEIRSYAPSLVAEVSLSGGRKATIQRGFSIIAGYIFGANEASQKIEMTAPVLQGRSSGDPTSERADAGNWVVQFIMPAKWSLDRLPKPKDGRIVLKPAPARTMAVIRFSGLAGDTSILSKTEELSTYLAKRHITPTGRPVYAFYNPPWTLPWFRRNEVLIPIQKTQ